MSRISSLVARQSAGQNVTVTARDPRIVYRGNWTDQDNGGHKFATSDGSGLSFSFNGTAIYYHATVNPLAAAMLASIDGGPTTPIDGSSAAVPSASPIPAILFAQTGLDPTKTHNLNVTYLGAGSEGGVYGEIYTLEYTQDSASPNTTTSASSASNTPSATSSSHTLGSTTTHSSKGPLIGGVVGGVLGGLLAIALVFWLVRRMRHRNAHPTPVTREINTHPSVDPYPITEPVSLPPSQDHTRSKPSISSNIVSSSPPPTSTSASTAFVIPPARRLSVSTEGPPAYWDSRE